MLNLPINLSILPREKYLGVTLENSYRQAVRPFSLLSAWSQFFFAVDRKKWSFVGASSGEYRGCEWISDSDSCRAAFTQLFMCGLTLLSWRKMTLLRLSGAFRSRCNWACRDLCWSSCTSRISFSVKRYLQLAKPRSCPFFEKRSGLALVVSSEVPYSFLCFPLT